MQRLLPGETQKEKNTWGLRVGFGLIHFKLFARHQVARTDTLCQGWGQPLLWPEIFLENVSGMNT